MLTVQTPEAMAPIHRKWTKSIGLVQKCDWFDRWPVVYSCLTCRMQICKDCTAVGKHKQLMSASGLGAYHVLETDSIDWSSNTLSFNSTKTGEKTNAT